MKLKLLLFFTLIICNALWSQAPANDNCENAEELLISDNGFGLGLFRSNSHNVEYSTKQRGEMCVASIEENGNCDKTVWFKFYISTTRNVSVKLTQQDSAIPQIFGAFNLYKIKDCDYNQSKIENAITPLNKFGESGNTCLSQGWYLIQAAFKSKARGEIWIELNVQLPQSTNYDDFQSPFNFGLVSDANLNQYFSFSCATVDKNESIFINDSLFSKSIFVTYTLPANSFYNSVYFNCQNSRIKYRIFKDNIHQDSINSNKPFIEITANNHKIQYDVCTNLSTSDVKYYIQFVGMRKEDMVNVNIQNRRTNTDLWNTTNTNDKINTYNGYSRMQTHKFNCTGILKNHSCKTVIPEYFTYTRKNYDNTEYTDTFKYGAYTVINSRDEGILELITYSIYNQSNSIYYVLYKGDVTQGCNLTYVTSSYTNNFKACIKAGVYTLVTACTEEIAIFTDRQYINQTNFSTNIKHFYPNNPEQMGNIISPSSLFLLGQDLTFRQFDTSISVDTFSRFGSFIFREFKLSNRGNIGITERISYTISRIYIFKGSFKQGNLKTIDGMHYPSKGNSYFSSSCVALDTGTYTIINWLDSIYYEDDCLAPKSRVDITYNSGCTIDTANHPTSAIRINNLADVLSSSANKVNLDYVYTLKKCVDCNSKNTAPAYLDRKKSYHYYDTKYTYFVFYLRHNVEFRINVSEFNFEIFKGNSRSNPNLIKDTNNIVSTCSGSMICNLEGGKYYTLVLFNMNYSPGATVYFTPHIASPNDYAVTAYDFGHFNSNETRSSSPMPITCHTNGFEQDPCYIENGEKKCLFNYYKDMAIPFKDTLNVKRPIMRKNLWYTFTVDKAANINVTISGNPAFKQVRQFSVFKYNGPYDESFSTLKSNGFDSTDASLEWITNNRRYYNNIDTRESSLSFKNTGCNPNRYFILIEDDYQSTDYVRYTYTLSINYTSQNYPISGDLCSDPQTASINGYGTQITQINNTCHTYGQSPFENQPISNIKTSWFKISLSNIGKCDLKVTNRSSNGLLYYNIYGGNCGSLTRITQVKDVNAYFTLSCMGAGDYYIQAFSTKSINSVLSFELSALQPNNLNCKPYDFGQPLAQFKYSGGCMNDTIRLTNFSSDGRDIKYEWYINNSYFSSSKEPYFTINHPYINSSNNQLKLLVKDINKGLKDSFVLTFIPDTTKYLFKIQGPAFSSCIDTIVLDVLTNFPYKINYNWTSPQDSRTLLDNKVVLTNVANNRVYFVTGISDNCKFNDSFHLPNIPLDLYRDTVICNDVAKLKLSTQKAAFFYLNNQAINSDSFVLSQSGTYSLYYNIKGCNHTEIFKLEIDSSKTTEFINDSFNVCNQDSFQIHYNRHILKNPLWNNGTVGQMLSVSQNGRYNLIGQINSCRDINYNADVQFKTLQMKLLNDTIFCYRDTFRFKPWPGQYTIIEQYPNNDYIIADKPFKTRIKVRVGNCPIQDSSWVYIYKPRSEFEKIDYCDTNESGLIKLSAHDGTSYRWIDNQDTSATVFVNSFGIHKVERINKGSCKDTLTFQVNNNCPFVIFMPSAFTPTNDNKNDVFQPLITGPYLKYTLTIFNRWGEILAELDTKGWDGLYMNEPVSQNVYAYILTVVDSKGRKYYLNGTFTLLR